jgi:hypothetical protein
MVDTHRVRIPLQARPVASGARVIHARLKLLVQTSKPSFASVDFLVDPGCGITSIPRTVAERVYEKPMVGWVERRTAA